MKITRKQLRQVIKETLNRLNESSAEYTETMWPQLDMRKEIGRINEKLVDLEEAIELMGGHVFSFKEQIKNITVNNDKGLKVAAPRAGTSKSKWRD
tara:strand:- start:321 stop:608 length:288 start_codon:yes stop_codon:yes gene_type:complete